MWDSIYYEGNPTKLQKVPLRPAKEIRTMFQKFGLLLKQITMLHSVGLLEIDSNLTASTKELTVTKEKVQQCYETSVRWPMKYFKYNPRFVQNHFKEFFNTEK
jgi:hypothetical protein